MNKAELTSAVATKLEVSKTEAGHLIETVIGEIITGAIATGECVVPGLGKLEVKETSARSGVSKMGGVEKAWTKPAGKKLALKLSKEGKSVTE
jgi:nucleoid DNA-binding protein